MVVVGMDEGGWGMGMGMSSDGVWMLSGEGLEIGIGTMGLWIVWKWSFGNRCHVL